ncbi:MAG TPA: MarR family transcriptional regulator [Kofleriaceae bacterium]|jgi:DNA-binding MarR family transcriptional regulator
MAALRRIVRYLRLADREAESGHGLSAAQLFVLHSLAGEPASSVAELARRALTDPSSASTVVTKLASKKLVVRVRSDDDKRRFSLALTRAGERVVRQTPRIVQTRITDGLGRLGPTKRREIVRALGVLVHAIGAGAFEPRMLFEDEPVKRRRGSLRKVSRGRAQARRRGSAT